MNPKDLFIELFHRYFGADPNGRSLKSSVPFGFTGQGAIWYSATIPNGWLKCDGSLVNRNDYPDLFIAIGVAWNTGGEAGTQFRLPNLSGRTAVGVDGGTFAAIATLAGAATVALSIAELPVHNHTMQMNKSDSEAGGYGLTLAAPFQNRVLIDQPASARVTGSTGSGTAHNNIQPSASVYYIIKT
jgi:microcystin-dependent protein